VQAVELKPDDVERWLVAEHEGLDGGAELAFARVLGGVPRVPPVSPDFAERVADAVWRASRRRRLALRVARLGASAAAIAASLTLAYMVLLQGGAWLIRGAVSLTLQTVSLVVRSAAEGLDWWSIVARVGAATGEALTTPQVSSVIVGIEIVGAVALFVLSRVLRAERNNPDSWEARS
jgi:hypothetical protein